MPPWSPTAASSGRARPPGLSGRKNYQDIVNDLLILIGQHTESATVRLYNYEDDLTVADTLEQATTEVQQETPMGAYAVEYITALQPVPAGVRMRSASRSATAGRRSRSRRW